MTTGYRYIDYMKRVCPPSNMNALGALYQKARKLDENVAEYERRNGKPPTGVFTVYRHANLAPFCAEEFTIDLQDLNSPSEG